MSDVYVCLEICHVHVNVVHLKNFLNSRIIHSVGYIMGEVLYLCNRNRRP